jgi:hypoxanthine phosphoribosyltransferase
MPEPIPSTVLLTAAQIHDRVAAMAARICSDCGERLHIVAVLKGAFVFLSDLVRHLDGRVSIDFIALSSYGGGIATSGDVRFLNDVDGALPDGPVLIVEDIVDTGLTLAALQGHLRGRGARTLRTACLLSKPSRRRVEVTVDYVGFEIEDRFVVGYGLDYAERYRNLPDIRLLDAAEMPRGPRV